MNNEKSDSFNIVFIFLDRDRRRRERRRENPNDLARVRAERAEKERERDQRTVFAAQIHPKNEEREIFDFFSDVGKVVDIQLIRDTRTYKSKGLAYIEFEDRRSVPHALALSGRVQLFSLYNFTV